MKLVDILSLLWNMGEFTTIDYDTEKKIAATW